MTGETYDTSRDRLRATPYPVEKARQGTIVLRKRWQQVTFFADLGGFAALVLLSAIRMIGVAARPFGRLQDAGYSSRPWTWAGGAVASTALKSSTTR